VTCGVWTGFYSGSKKEIYPEAFSVDTVMPIWMDAILNVVKNLRALALCMGLA